MRAVRVRMKFHRILALTLCAVLCCALALPTLAVQNSAYNDDWLYVAIDPGHGGVDSGCVATYDGKQYTERDICMQIGLYLKEELESYQHVKVIMTRTPDTPSSALPSGEVKSRMVLAQKESCDFLISLHLNDVGMGTHVPNGACALVSNGNYRPEVAEAGKAVAAVTLAELEKLGVENKGFLLRDSADTKYPNGKVADYYGIVRYGIQMNVPSTLIEHCFLRNENDFRTLLSSDEKLRAVAKADAAGIVQYFGLEKKEPDSEPEVAPVRLTDVSTHWAADYISAAVKRGWINGYPDRTFRPNATLSRADFVTLLSRMSGEDLSECTGSPFTDVPESKYYAPSVVWAVNAGIISGFPDGTFHPTENVTREQMAHIMRLYLQHAGLDITLTDPTIDIEITDIQSVGSWARDDVRFCYTEGLLQGRSTGFDPKGTATRAEAATVLMRLFDYANPPADAEAESAAQPQAFIMPETPIYSGVMPNEAA